MNAPVYSLDNRLSFNDVIEFGKCVKVSYDIIKHDFAPYQIVHLQKDQGDSNIENYFYVMGNNNCELILSINTKSKNIACALVESVFCVIDVNVKNNTAKMLNDDIKLNKIDSVYKKLCDIK